MLVNLLFDAHDRSALRGNVSHEALKLAAIGSGDYFKSIAAALMTLGGLHAPLERTEAFLRSPDILVAVDDILSAGLRIPGWGNSFVRGHDPIWEPVRLALQEFPVSKTIEAVTQSLHDRGKDIYPNPSCYTAAVAIVEGLEPGGIGEWLILGRLHAWTQEYLRIRREAPRL